MGARAGPPPIPCPFDQPRPHRIERQIAPRRRQVLLVQQISIQRVVGVIEKGARAAIAALGDVVSPSIDFVSG
jgi:hypothetical protein